jgi:hypothetical protein
MTRRRVLLAGVTAGALLAGAPSGAAPRTPGPVQRVDVRNGAVSAEFSYRKDVVFYRDLQLEIRRGGKALFDKQLRRIRACALCRDAVAFGSPPLLIRDLDGDREPEVVLNLYSGGASCCSYTLVFFFDSPRYRFRIGYWGRYPHTLTDVGRDGRSEFVGRNPAFDGRFTFPVSSAGPLQIWRFRRGKLRDVTREFPRLVARDSRKLLRLYEEERKDELRDARGVLAAYLADQYLLGQEREAWRVLERALRRGELGRTGADDGWATGRSYLRDLRTFLREHGYARR